MPATVTLATTTLQERLGPTAEIIKVASTAGIRPNMRLFVDGELMTVLSLGIDPWVKVIRGVGGMNGSPHSSLVTVYIGTADQFYQSDPVGRPSEAVLVSPYINVKTGVVWFAQGDVEPVGLATRWWQPQTSTYDIGPLGVRTLVQSPTSST